MILHFYVKLEDVDMHPDALVVSGFDGHSTVCQVKYLPKNSPVKYTTVLVGELAPYSAHVFPAEQQLYIQETGSDVLWKTDWSFWTQEFPVFKKPKDIQLYKTFFSAFSKKDLDVIFSKWLPKSVAPPPTSDSWLFDELHAVEKITKKAATKYKWILSEKGLTINGEQSCDVSSVTPF